MKLISTFPGQVALTLSAISTAAVYPLAEYASGEVIRSAVAGSVLATCNVLAGYASIRLSVGKSMSTFMKFVLGGMGVRLLILSVVIILLIRSFGFHPVALVVSLGVFYAAFLTIEILFIQKHLNTRQSN